MIKLKEYYRKNRRGAILKVVREQYLRDDLSCGFSSCEAGCSSSFDCLQPTLPKIVILDTSVAVHQVDFLDALEGVNLVMPQTVLQELKRRNPPAYKRLMDLLLSPENSCYLFHNEFHEDTFIARTKGESADERNERAIRVVVKFYKKHLRRRKRKSDGAVKENFTILLLSDDPAQRAACAKESIEWITTKDLAESLPEQPGLVDKVAQPDSGDSGGKDVIGHKGKCFERHLPLAALNTGIKSGDYKQGSIQISRENYLEAQVFVDGEEEPIFVQGLMTLNRAVHGDQVAIEMLPREQWATPAALLRMAELDAHEDPGDEIENEDAELKKAGAQAGVEPLPSARVVGVIRRNWRPYCGMLLKSSVPGSTRHLFLPAERRIPRIRITTRQADILAGQRIIVSIDSWPINSRYPQGHYVRSLGPLGDRETENEVLLLEHDVPHGAFSQRVLDCLPQLPWLITEEDMRARKDLRHLDICSVDPPSCTDIDDALHCRELGDGTFEVGVHIADVSHFVLPHTEIDTEAAKRGTTVYLVDRRIDMLPDLLSSNLCSLRGGEERFAFSVVWRVTRNAEILSIEFHKSLIKSRQAFTYGEAQARIDDPTLNDPVTQGLRGLLRLSKALRAKRRAAGALTLASLEIRFNIDSETHDPIEVQAKQALETNSMVEEFMLLANVSVAERIYQEFPDCAVLRRHATPPPSNYKPIVQAAKRVGLQITIDSGKALSQSLDAAVLPRNPYFNTMLRMLTTRCMTQAEYFSSGTLELAQFYHFGLASKIYTHFTSPIRRFADLLVHRLLAVATKAGRTYPELVERKKVQKICENLNYRHKMAQYAGRASVLLNTHLFFKSRKEELDGYVMGIRKNAFQVLVPKYGLESPVVVPRGSPLKFNENEGSLSCGDIVLRIFDPVKIQLFVDTKDVQHQKLVLKLVKPEIPGFSVQPLVDVVN